MGMPEQQRTAFLQNRENRQKHPGDDAE